MIDKISQDRIKLLHPKIREEVSRLVNEINTTILTGRAKMRVTSTLRTFAEQTALYNLGRTVKNRDGITKSRPMGQVVTNAKAGQSNHNYGLSFDFALIVDSNEDLIYDQTSWDTKKDYDGDLKSDWLEVINYFKLNGYSWGGDWISFKDMPHLEKTFKLTVKECLTRYTAKKFIPGTTYIII